MKLIGIPRSASSIFSKSHKQDGTCAGICDTQGVHPDWPCQCNVFCVQFGDCCPDYETACLSCADRCNSAFNANLPCQCTTQCQNFNDCCADYGDVCDGGQPEPGTVTNAEIIQLVDDMSAVDFNNMASGITFDLQSSTTGSDTSPNPLFPEEIPEVYLQIPTVAALLNLFDNYHPLVSIQESFTPEQESEIEVFLDAVFDTEVFRVMTDFFLAKGMKTTQVSIK
ncbi:unnamed protein product [Notodromas monacha]|uniref:Uncharacterized protein n=1 Tax=Notodromas monacha TaxID=399045 RepID=A0A7R9BJX3_9CRUS|nr:unnamed protein product [Notodromas monacha]CAG0915515.1 unnamed protein product [Notodromas monacha]